MLGYINKTKYISHIYRKNRSYLRSVKTKKLDSGNARGVKRTKASTYHLLRENRFISYTFYK